MAYGVGYPTNLEKESLFDNASLVSIDIPHIMETHVDVEHDNTTSIFTGEFRKEAMLVALIKTAIANGKLYSSKDEMGFVIGDKFEMVYQCGGVVGKKWGESDTQTVRLIMRTDNMTSRTDWKRAFIVTAYPDQCGGRIAAPLTLTFSRKAVVFNFHLVRFVDSVSAGGAVIKDLGLFKPD